MNTKRNSYEHISLYSESNPSSTNMLIHRGLSCGDHCMTSNFFHRVGGGGFYPGIKRDVVAKCHCKWS